MRVVPIFPFKSSNNPSAVGAGVGCIIGTTVVTAVSSTLSSAPEIHKNLTLVLVLSLSQC